MNCAKSCGLCDGAPYFCKNDPDFLSNTGAVFYGEISCNEYEKLCLEYPDSCDPSKLGGSDPCADSMEQEGTLTGGGGHRGVLLHVRCKILDLDT